MTTHDQPDHDDRRPGCALRAVLLAAGFWIVLGALLLVVVGSPV